jgi:hypothetical protein
MGGGEAQTDRVTAWRGQSHGKDQDVESSRGRTDLLVDGTHETGDKFIPGQ